MTNGKRPKGDPNLLGYVAVPTSVNRGSKAPHLPNAVPPLPPNPFSEHLELPPRDASRKKAIAAKEAFEAKYPSESITMRIPGKTLLAAKAIAEKKGVGYQTYLKMLIHEGLERDKGLLDRDA